MYELNEVHSMAYADKTEEEKQKLRENVNKVISQILFNRKQ